MTKVNTPMLETPQTNNQPAQEKPISQARPSRPNESSRLEVMDHVRIFDPNTKEVMVEKRA